ncbi:MULTISPECIES: hypothetical protein [Paraburkholderia]|uniref:Uncharacterized protein n=2 Tax=Paraburkholderia TaxID=1822464 RepID=A0A7Y9W9F4_9BURK|nr:hypothetical protein [Paraburkholderia bryophila]NYH16111.1 hypothetical protein [Paraburkholderia bryophila]NYH25456.1 hypothetical protein [Paraburkholderia bryophila]
MALSTSPYARSKLFCYSLASEWPVWLRVFVGVGVVASLAACSTPDPNQRVTGSGGTLVKYSSAQVSVDLTATERNALAGMRDRSFVGASSERALTAVAAALKASGYAPVTVEADTALVEGGRSEVLVQKWRELVRGVLKARLGGLPAKPDHQYTAALVSVRPAVSGPGVIVRARFDNTVWDSNGDARTKTVLAREDYDAFFTKVDAALRGNAAPLRP